MILAPPREVAVDQLVRPGAAFVAALGSSWLTLRFGVRGVLPSAWVALLLPLALLLLVVSFFRFGVALGPFTEDERGASRPLRRRHGFWLVATGIVLFAPLYGSFSLTDPWETHYAEVAREMIARRDFVSPWWANEGLFMTKPVLTFWLEASAMVVFGAGVEGADVLAGPGGSSGFAHPEWAIRFPTFALSILGAYALYFGISRTVGRRAGFIGGLALLTMPGYALLAHQAITDMPLVAGSAASLGALLVALEGSPHAELRRYAITFRGRRVVVHGGHLLAVAFAFLLVPQALAILGSHVVHGAHGLRLGLDRWAAGSPHNCGLPGQPRCTLTVSAHPRLQPFVQVGLWAPVASLIGLEMKRIHRTAPLFAIAAALFAAVGTMAKGPLGLFVPAAALVAYLLRERSLAPLRRFGLVPVLVALAAIVLTIGPWYLAVFARHGRGFIDELVFRHMLGRTLEHLHDTNEGEDVGLTYFVRQLGYATFPWSGFALIALLGQPCEDDASRRSRAKSLLFGAVLAVFALVSLMHTKFHHYMLPMLPPVASLLGIGLDEATTDRGSARGARLRAFALVAGGVTARVAVDLTTHASGATPSGAARFMHLMTYRYTRTWPSVNAFGAFFIAITLLAVAAAGLWMFRRSRRFGVAMLMAVAMTNAAVLVDGYLPRAASDGGQRRIYEAYRREVDPREAPPLVAYRLNWKGENFYTGNHVAIFISGGAPFRDYLAARKKAGQSVVYFVTEQGGVSMLRAEVGPAAKFTVVTDAATSHEFRLVRVDLA